DLLSRALAIRSQLFGPQDPQVLNTEQELASIPVDAQEETSVAKHSPVAKEISVDSEPFPEIDPSTAPKPVPSEPPSITSELSLLLMDLPASDDAWLVGPPNPPPSKTPPKPMDKGTVTVEMNALDLHSGHEPLVETVPPIAEETCVPIQTTSPAV